ncbi:MAG: hypothetical protein U0451_00535 [Candidatus Saccharimonadales bacterium]
MNSEFFIGGHRVTATEPDVLERLYRTLRSYTNLQARLGKVQQALDVLVKPDGFAAISFIG